MAGVACVEGEQVAALLQRHRGGVAPAHATQAQQKCELFMSIAASKVYSTVYSTRLIGLCSPGGELQRRADGSDEAAPRAHLTRHARPRQLRCLH